MSSTRSFAGIGLLVLSATAPAFGAIITVPTDQPTIQAAVTAPMPGDTIKIKAGVYFENVTVPAGKDGLQILGTNADTTIVDAQPMAPTGTGPGFDISSNNVTLAKLTVRHARFDPGFTLQAEGVRCVATGCTLQDLNLISNGDDGASISGNNAIVTDSFFSGNAGGGLRLLNSSNSQILRNVAQNQDNGGFNFFTVNNTLIQGNTANVIEDDEGFEVAGNNNMILKNSTSTTDDPGFKVDGDGNTLSGNEVVNAEDDGINVNGAMNIVTGNSVQGAEQECYDLVGDNPVVENNTATSCGGDGFSIFGNNPVVENNTAESSGDDGFRISGDNPVVEKNTVAFSLGGGGFDINGSNPQVIGNRAEFLADEDGFRISCTTACTELLVQRNTAISAGNDDEGFDISVDSGTGTGWIVERNTATDNVSQGFAISGSGGIIRRNKALRNGSEGEDGFEILGSNNDISFNQALNNEGDGFDIEGNNNTIFKNKADRNLLDGIHLDAGNLNTLSENSAAKNQADGIRNDGTSTTLTDNKSKANRTDCTSDLAGLFPGPPATVTTDTGNKCADGSSFSLTQTDGIH